MGVTDDVTESEVATTEQDPEARTQGGSTNPLVGDVSGAREIAIRQREAEMVALRLSGASVDAIAERYEIHHTRVSHIISRAMRRSQAPAAELREIELRRLDRIIQAFWRAALGLRPEGADPESALPEADAKAADIVIKALDRRARLLGLDKIVVEVGMSQEERSAALADSMRAYLQGRADQAAEEQIVDA